MSEPKTWTLPELEADAFHSREVFRRQRLEEPLARYSQFFEESSPILRDLIGRLTDLVREPLAVEGLIDLLRDEQRRTAFRYLAAPPISDDDLRTLAQTTFSAAALAADAEQVRRVRDTVLHVIDPYRIPWIREGRAPAGDELETAVVASAADFVLSTRDV